MVSAALRIPLRRTMVVAKLRTTPCLRLRSVPSSGRCFSTSEIIDRSFQTVSDSHTAISTDKPGSKAFSESESYAIADLFHAHADSCDTLGREGIRSLLESIGERPTEETIDDIFERGDLDGNGRIDLEEFMLCSDQILAEAPARIVLVVGGPGSGKGRLCSRLEKECDVVHLSSGDLLRDEVKRGTVLGKEVSEIMERGELVSSAVIVALVKRRMRNHPGKRVLLDGFPRSLQNAEDLMELCGKPELAVHLECDDTVMLERILNRGENRADDNFQTAINRLRTYHKSHNTTMDWLRSQGVPIVNLDCSGTPNDVWDQLLAIGRLMRPACKIGKQDADDDKIGFL